MSKKQISLYVFLIISICSCKDTQKKNNDFSENNNLISISNNQVHIDELAEEKINIKPNFHETEIYFYNGKLFNGVAFDYGGKFSSKTYYYINEGLIEKIEEYENNKLISTNTYKWGLKYGYGSTFYRISNETEARQKAIDTAHIREWYMKLISK